MPNGIRFPAENQIGGNKVLYFYRKLRHHDNCSILLTKKGEESVNQKT